MRRKCTTYNMGFCASWAEEITIGFQFFIVLQFGQKFFNWAFEYIFLHLFFNRQRLRADGILIPILHKALSVIGNAADVHQSKSVYRNYKVEDFVKSPRAELVFQFTFQQHFSFSSLFSICSGRHLTKSIFSQTGFARQNFELKSLQHRRFTLIETKY